MVRFTELIIDILVSIGKVASFDRINWIWLFLNELKFIILDSQSLLLLTTVCPLEDILVAEEGVAACFPRTLVDVLDRVALSYL